MEHEDLISFIVSGLNPTFNNFVTNFSFTTSEHGISFDDFQEELLNHEIILNKEWEITLYSHEVDTNSQLRQLQPIKFKKFAIHFLPSNCCTHMRITWVFWAKKMEMPSSKRCVFFFSLLLSKFSQNWRQQKKALVAGGEKALVAVWGEEAKLGWDNREKETFSSPILLPFSSPILLFFSFLFLFSFHREQKDREKLREKENSVVTQERDLRWVLVGSPYNLETQLTQTSRNYKRGLILQLIGRWVVLDNTDKTKWAGSPTVHGGSTMAEPSSASFPPNGEQRLFPTSNQRLSFFFLFFNFEKIC